MNELIHRPEPEPEVVEPEIVGLRPPPPPFWKRALARAAAGLFLGLTGLSLCLIGTVLTVTIVGASLGIPLILTGLCITLLAFWVFTGGGKIALRRHFNDEIR